MKNMDWIYFMKITLNYVQKIGSLKSVGKLFFPRLKESREPAIDTHFPCQYIMFQAKQSILQLLRHVICCMKGTQKLDSQVGEYSLK